MTILDAERLWPDWSHALRMRWVRAATHAATLKPVYGRLLPMTTDQMTTVGGVMAPRTLRESGL